MNPIQRERLAALSLKGDSNKWYKTWFSEEERLTITWGEYTRRFDLHFISTAVVRAGKEIELLAFERGV